MSLRSTDVIFKKLNINYILTKNHQISGGQSKLKNYELKPTDANILKCLTNNTIDRNDDMYSLVKLLQNIDSGCSIAINGSWGSGKTFLLNKQKCTLMF
jgi:DNA replication protein DnaC